MSLASHHEGWILYRSLIDRLVYLYYLLDNDKFLELDEWTFIESFEHRNSAKADERFKHLVNKPLFKKIEGDGRTDNDLKKKKTNWIKPDPFQILEAKGLDFIYKFGYDYASKHTHPMSWDGELEFYFTTGLEPNPHREIDQTHLINNSMLVSSIILNLVISNLSISIPDKALIFLAEFKKLTLKQQHTFDETFAELFDYYRTQNQTGK